MNNPKKEQPTSVIIIPGERSDTAPMVRKLDELGYENCIMNLHDTDLFQKIEGAKPSVAIMDASFVAQESGVLTAHHLSQKCNLPIIWSLNEINLEAIKKVTTLPGYGYLFQPIKLHELQVAIDTAICKFKSDSLIQNAKHQWEKTIDSVPQIIALVDTEYNLLRVNKYLSEKLGLSFDQLLGEKCYKLIHGLDSPPDYCPLHGNVEDASPVVVETYEENLGGHIQIHFLPYIDAQRGIKGYIHVLRDISIEKEIEEKLRHDKAFLQGIIDGIGDEVTVVRPDRRTIMMNKAAKANLPKLGKFQQLSCHEIYHSKKVPCADSVDGCPLDIIQKTGEAITLNHWHEKSGGRPYPVEVLASPLYNSQDEFSGIVSVSRDVSRRHALEEENKILQKQLFQQRQDDLVSQMATGFSHQFNNLLMGILGNAELMSLDKNDSEAVARYSEQVKLAAVEMSHLSKKMSFFTKRKSVAKFPIDLNNLIKYVMAYSLEKKVHDFNTIEKYTGDLWEINGNHKQLCQLFAGLIKNAVEAMELGGDLFLKTCNETLKIPLRCHASESGYLKPGDYVAVQVADIGEGIPAKELHRIFEPFYSTKFVGRGIDLAIAALVVKAHGGGISVKSKVKKGTNVTVYLPRFAEAETRDTKTNRKEVKNPLGNILIVDDEKDYLYAMERVLQETSKELYTVTSGEEALNLINNNPDRFDLIVLDIRLEGISGRDVYKQLKQMGCGAKILIASGYDRNTALEGIILHENDDFIQKPFKLDVVIDKLKNLARLNEPLS